MVKNINQGEYQNVINLILSVQRYNVKPRQFSLHIDPFAWMDMV